MTMNCSADLFAALEHSLLSLVTAWLQLLEERIADRMLRMYDILIIEEGLA